MLEKYLIPILQKFEHKYMFVTFFPQVFSVLMSWQLCSCLYIDITKLYKGRTTEFIGLGVTETSQKNNSICNV